MFLGIVIRPILIRKVVLFRFYRLCVIDFLFFFIRVVGYVLFLLWEVVTGRKVSDQFMERAVTIGFFLMIGLMIYALGLDAGSSGIPLRVDGETHEAVLDLPTSGTRAELKLEYSADLEVWDVLGLDGPEGAMITLVVGSSGEVRIPLPSGRRGFVRLRI